MKAKARTAGWIMLAICGLMLVSGCERDTEVEVSIRSMSGLWIRQDGGSAGMEAKDYESDGTGFFGHIRSGEVVKIEAYRWTLAGNVSTEFWQTQKKTFNEEVVYLDENFMQLRRVEDGKVRVWRRQVAD
ncbi:MAG: hypothetical protein HQ559_00085 [Lentisphaerae bacterium]|nr:hypothetical protein [Lentisphaerota bacterium]